MRSYLKDAISELRCACCGAPMRPDESAPAPEGTPDTLLYHAEFRDCVRIALAHLVETTPAYLGAPPLEEPRP